MFPIRKVRNYQYGNNNNCIKSYLRIFHASPNAPAVDVYANDTLVAERLYYKQFTEYFPVLPGNYRIQVFPSGKKTNPVYETKINVDSNKIYTAAAIGLLPDISLLVVPEPYEKIPMGMSAIRFSHLSPTAPNVDITLPDGTVVFSNIGYTDTTDYIAVPPDIYTLQARLTGTDTIVLTVPNIKLYPGKYYTVYAVGLPGDEPPLQVVIPLDGLSYIPICKGEPA